MAKYIVTKEDIENKRFPKNVKEGSEVDVPDTNPEQGEKSEENILTEKQAELSEEMKEKMASYLEHYPDAKLFHISSDGQVFLESNKQAAIDHQNSLDENVKLVTYEC